MVRFPRFFGFAGILSMALFRIVLWQNKNFHFYKLMGSGKNGTFDIQPDWLQWCVLVVVKDYSSIHYLPSFITKYWQLFKAKKLQLILEPYMGHGTWEGKKCFGSSFSAQQKDNPIAVLTRASIRLSKLKQFWNYVPIVAATMKDAKGLQQSFGVGETPFIKQATLSVWENELAIKNFAYNMQQHKEVVKKTRTEDWYSEDMFTRFNVLAINGNLQ